MYCKNCGIKVNEEQENCSNCGNKNTDIKVIREIKEINKTILIVISLLILGLLILAISINSINCLMIVVLFFFMCLIALILGMVNPKIVIKWGDLEKINRKNVIKYYGIGAIVLYVLTRGCAIIMVNNSMTSLQSSSAIYSQQGTTQIIKVTPKELSDDYKANEVNADNKYKGKIGVLAGKIYSISVSGGNPVISLVNTNDKYEYTIADVQCHFDDNSQSTKIANLSKGQIITIKGIVDGYFVSVSMDHCTIQ